jgi:hypothetical protein
LNDEPDFPIPYRRAPGFSEKLRMMLGFEGDPSSADYVLDEWLEALLAHAAKPTIPVFVVSAVAAPPRSAVGPGTRVESNPSVIDRACARILWAKFWAQAWKAAHKKARALGWLSS